MQKYGVIYKITNKINGKCYIGQTKNSFKERYSFTGNGIERVYNYHKNLKEKNKMYNKHIFYAIKKYGFNSFEINEELDIAYSPEELDNKEIYYIDKFNSFNNGYNKNIGGNGNRGLFGKSNSFYGKKHNDKTKKYLSEINIGKKATKETRIKMSINNCLYWKGKQLPESIRIKISETRKLRGIAKGENNPMYGVHLQSYWKDKHLPKDMILKRSKTLKENGTFKGKNNPSAKKVICITTNRIFNTMKEAGEFYNCNPASICSCCKYRSKSAGTLNDKKLVWRYVEDN